MAGHAELSPSAAERWLSCPASVRLSKTAPPTESVYAREGTLAHTRAELEAARSFGLIEEAEYKRRLGQWTESVPDAHDRDDMARAAVGYVELLTEIVDSEPSARLLLEKRVNTGVPRCWGTADAIVASPEHLTVVDYKYGQGVRVDAEDNPQLRLYALGALELVDTLFDVEDVTYTVYQPRLGHVSSETVSSILLREWREEVVIPAAQEALSQDAGFGPSAQACRFCPVAGECRPRALHMTRTDFGDPDLLTPEEMARHLARVSEIKDWLAALEQAGLERAYARGEEIPGWKVVLSGGRRSIPDTEAAAEVLTEAGFDRSQVTRTTMQTLGRLERLTGKDRLADLLGDLLVKSEGKPSLVPQSDPRPEAGSADGARKDFT